MADKVPDRLMIGNNVSIHASDPFGHHSCENNISSVPELPDSNGESGNHLPCNGNRISTEGERVEQIEPGVYITVASSPGGDKYLKRVRFRCGFSSLISYIYVGSIFLAFLLLQWSIELFLSSLLCLRNTYLLYKISLNHFHPPDLNSMLL